MTIAYAVFCYLDLELCSRYLRQVLHQRGTPPPTAVRRRQAGEDVAIAADGVGVVIAGGGVGAAEAAVVITPKKKNLTPIAATCRLLIK